MYVPIIASLVLPWVVAREAFVPGAPICLVALIYLVTAVAILVVHRLVLVNRSSQLQLSGMIVMGLHMSLATVITAGSDQRLAVVALVAGLVTVLVAASHVYRSAGLLVVAGLGLLWPIAQVYSLVPISNSHAAVLTVATSGGLMLWCWLAILWAQR